MATRQNEQKNTKASPLSWAAAGFAVGFAPGYIVLESWVSGIILGIGLAIAMGMASKTYTKKSN